MEDEVFVLDTISRCIINEITNNVLFDDTKITINLTNSTKIDIYAKKIAK